MQFRFPTFARRLIGAGVGLLISTAALSQTFPAAPPQPPRDTPYPGTLTLQVDATDLDRRIFRVRETVPVAAGPLRLYYPRWMPGTHGPTGRIAGLAGLKISGERGQPIAWRRDPLDPHAFALDVPAGVSTLEIEFQHLSPISRDGGRAVVTPEMVNVQWNTVLLYPAGHHDSRISVKPSLRLPEGWSFGSALQAESKTGATTEFKPVSVETLIDSPVFAGKHMTRVDLDPEATTQGRAPIFLNVMADVPGELAIGAEQLAAHRALVAQADRLFGARHFAHYDFLLAISERLGRIGLEHHQSSENGVAPGYFAEWAKSSVGRDLLPHEFVHSWNGKFRRPADLLTPNTNTPMQDSLLWLYEGQTQFWGDVLAARSGLVPVADMRDTIANVAAATEAQRGRDWRNLQDTTNQPTMNERREESDWRDWQRGSDVGRDNALSTVRWGSPAFEAGLSTSVQLLAVNGVAYKAERLKAAITEAKSGKAPIALLVRDGDRYKTVSIAYTGGLRYPKLERIEGTEDRLTQVLSPRS